MAEAERQALLEAAAAAHRGHNGHIPSGGGSLGGHHHRRRSHEVRSSRLGSYVNGHGEAATEAAEAGATTTAVDNVDLLGNVMQFQACLPLLFCFCFALFCFRFVSHCFFFFA